MIARSQLEHLVSEFGAFLCCLCYLQATVRSAADRKQGVSPLSGEVSENQQSFVNGIFNFFICGEARDVVRSARLAPGAE